MKIFNAMLLLFMFCSCSDSKKEEKPITEAEEKQTTKELFSYTSETDKQNIALISAIHEINNDTVKAVISEYLSSTLSLTDDTKIDYTKALYLISLKYNMDRKTVAKLIYDYKSLEIHIDGE